VSRAAHLFEILAEKGVKELPCMPQKRNDTESTLEADWWDEKMYDTILI